jgi:methionyl-tRNA formyltransferase
MLRVVFFGMDLRVLDALQASQVDLVGAYLPQAPHWMGPFLDVLPRFIIKRWLTSVAVYRGVRASLVRHHIPALCGRSVNTAAFRDRLSALAPDLVIVSNFGEVLGRSLLSIPRHGFVNYHPSLLPRYRGPTPFEHILLGGDEESGITWHQITDKVDQGDILVQESYTISPEDTVSDLDKKSIRLALRTLGPLLEDIEYGRTRPRPQDEADATVFAKATRVDRERLASREQGAAVTERSKQ